MLRLAIKARVWRALLCTAVGLTAFAAVGYSLTYYMVMYP